MTIQEIIFWLAVTTGFGVFVGLPAGTSRRRGSKSDPGARSAEAWKLGRISLSAQYKRHRWPMRELLFSSSQQTGQLRTQVAHSALGLQPLMVSVRKASTAIVEDALVPVRLETVEANTRATQTHHATSSQVKPSAEIGLSDDEILALYELCDKAPKRGLAKIATLDPQLQRDPIILVAKLIAYRRLIYGMPNDGKRYESFAALVRSLDAEQRGFAMDGLATISLIESIDGNFFVGNEVRQLILDSICRVADTLDPGCVQVQLGWTKLDYFVVGGRVLIPKKKTDPINERLADVPMKAFGTLYDIRVAMPVVSRLAMATIGRYASGSGWIVFFTMFELAAVPKGRTAGDANLLGILMLSESGNWRFDKFD